MVRNMSLGYQAIHLGMMGEYGRTEAAPEEPQRRGAAALLSCTESLHGIRITAVRNFCLSWGMLQAGILHAGFLRAAAGG